MYHNIEKSGFHPGQYVGYGAGTFRIKQVGKRWRATEQSTGETFTAPNLRVLSTWLASRAAAEARRNVCSRDLLPALEF